MMAIHYAMILNGGIPWGRNMKTDSLESWESTDRLKKSYSLHKL